MMWAKLCGAVAAAAVLLAAEAISATPAPADVSDEVCVGCHLEPNAKFHSQTSHKKLACTQCHRGGAEHVADTRARPKLGGDPQLCTSCHDAKKKQGG